MARVPVRELTAADAPRCDEIIASLPYFFGQEAGIRACAEAVRSQRGWTATRGATVTGNGAAAGFLTVDYPLATSPEITWMAVHATARRDGLGRALVEHAARELGEAGAQVLSVLTLAESEPEPGTDNYSGTRAFYRAMEFLPVRELRPDGWVHQALLLVRPLHPH